MSMASTTPADMSMVGTEIDTFSGYVDGIDRTRIYVDFWY
jgi:hypothetical protein